MLISPLDENLPRTLNSSKTLCHVQVLSLLQPAGPSLPTLTALNFPGAIPQNKPSSWPVPGVNRPPPTSLGSPIPDPGGPVDHVGPAALPLSHQLIETKPTL